MNTTVILVQAMKLQAKADQYRDRALAHFDRDPDHAMIRHYLTQAAICERKAEQLRAEV